MHDLHPVFSKFSRDPRLENLPRNRFTEARNMAVNAYLQTTAYRRWKLMALRRNVLLHQTADRKSFWFAIDDSTVENGCLWVAGKCSQLRQQFIVKNGRSSMRRLNDAAWPEVKDARPLEVPSGSLLFDGLLPHFSAPNTSGSARHAFTLRFRWQIRLLRTKLASAKPVSQSRVSA